MKKNSLFILKLALAAADVLTLIASFVAAYFIRTRLDSRPIFFRSNLWEILGLIVVILPLWLITMYLLGLYRRSVFLYRPKEYGRIVVATIISVMLLITFDFFAGGAEIFPVRTIALYFVVINFILLIFARGVVKFIYRRLLKHGIGRQRVVIIGSGDAAHELFDFFDLHPTYGYEVVGVVADERGLSKAAREMNFISLKAAIKHVRPDLIIQASNAHTEENYTLAVEHHMGYLFAPSQDILLSRLNEIELVGTQPVIDVKLTRLVGSERFLKRFFDIFLGVLALILTSWLWLIIIIIMKISEPRTPIFFRQVRLTRFNREFRIFKFHSMYEKYWCSPEEAFRKMGRPELIEKYRAGGDQLERDPRITPLGRFLRATSLDELPQILNVIKGDISLVGPRALVPNEINQYEKKSVVLAVRSGITGLAQVSGRKDIPFEERRRLDVYYVQHWSLLLDLQILLKTVKIVLTGAGAK